MIEAHSKKKTVLKDDQTLSGPVSFERSLKYNTSGEEACILNRVIRRVSCFIDLARDFFSFLTQTQHPWTCDHQLIAHWSFDFSHTSEQPLWKFATNALGT